MIVKYFKLLLQKYRQYKADKFVKSLRSLAIKGCKVPYEFFNINKNNDFQKIFHEELEKQKNIIEWPISIGKSIGKLYSNNEVVSLWYQPSSYPLGSYKRFYHGMAWSIPKIYNGIYNDMKIIKIFGVIPESIIESDSINLLIDIGDNEEIIESLINVKEKLNSNDREDMMDAKVSEHVAK